MSSLKQSLAGSDTRTSVRLCIVLIAPVQCFVFTRSLVQVSVVLPALPLLLPIIFLSTPTWSHDVFRSRGLRCHVLLSLSGPVLKRRSRKQSNSLLRYRSFIVVSVHRCSTFRLVTGYQSKDGRTYPLIRPT